jgi:DNA-binding protein HU-beta
MDWYADANSGEDEDMTKAELIDAMATKIDLPKATAERAVNMIFDDIVSALKANDKVNISGFGTFTVSQRKARQGRNPKTGETIEIQASRSAKFKPGKGLKDSLN